MQNFKKILNLQEDVFTEAISEVIRRHRTELGISRDRLAFEVGLHKNSLYGIEIGYKRKDAPFRHQQISLFNFIRLASVCREDPGDFLDEVIKCAMEIQAR